MTEPDKSPSITRADLEHGISISIGTALGVIAGSLVFGKFHLAMLGWIACLILAFTLPFSTLMHRRRRLKKKSEDQG